MHAVTVSLTTLVAVNSMSKGEVKEDALLWLRPKPPRQFSLRTLFVLVLASAVVFGVGRVLGMMVLWGLVFATLWAVPLVILKRSSKLAYVLAWSAVYAPFVAMAVYTLSFVDCSHCTATAWMLLPYAPGLLLVELARRPLDLPRPPEELWFAISFIAAVVIVERHDLDPSQGSLVVASIVRGRSAGPRHVRRDRPPRSDSRLNINRFA